MPGRHAKPLKLHVMNGNKAHLTKAEIEQRREYEIRLGDSSLTMPAIVRRDPVAKREWKRLEKLYDGIEFVSSSDRGIMTDYCLACSELESLINDLNTISDLPPFSPAEESGIIEEFEDHLGKMAAKRMWEKIEFIMSAAGKIPFNKAIDSKRALIRSLRDRLFLDPLAKLKNIPKKEKAKKADPLAEAGFGGI